MRGCPGAEASREPEKGKRALLEGQVRAASPAGALTKREPTRPTSKCCPCTNYLQDLSTTKPGYVARGDPACAPPAPQKAPNDFC